MESDQERCLSLKQDINAVHIANLHKVKGLEAPIVILAKSGKNNNMKAGIRVEYSDEAKTNKTLSDGYICAIKDPDNTRFNIIETNSLKAFAEKEVNSLKNEVDRLIYVAATRARNVLIVNDTYQRRGKNAKISSSGKSNQWHYLVSKAQDEIFNVVPENDNGIEQIDNEVNADDLYKNVSLVKLDALETYKYKKPSDVKYLPITNDSPIEDENNDNNDAKIIGTIVHRLMEMMIMSKDKLPKEYLVNNILNEYLTADYVDKKDKYKEMLEKVFDVMHNGGYKQENDTPQDILSTLIGDDASVSCEVPFSFKDDKERIWSGVVDLLYIKDNKAYIIDWKTNKNNIDLDEHYKNQLEDYKYAVEQLLKIPVISKNIYHIAVSSK